MLSATTANMNTGLHCTFIDTIHKQQFQISGRSFEERNMDFVEIGMPKNPK